MTDDRLPMTRTDDSSAFLTPSPLERRTEPETKYELRTRNKELESQGTEIPRALTPRWRKSRSPFRRCRPKTGARNRQGGRYADLRDATLGDPGDRRGGLPLPPGKGAVDGIAVRRRRDDHRR